MKPDLTRRLANLESATLHDFHGMAFFEVKDGVYTESRSGRRYTKAEFHQLVERYPTCAFLPVNADPAPAEEFTLEDLQAWNEANAQPDFDPTTHPNPRIRALAAQADPPAAQPDPFWDEQLRRMGRQDVIDAREHHSERQRRIMSGEGWRGVEDAPVE